MFTFLKRLDTLAHNHKSSVPSLCMSPLCPSAWPVPLHHPLTWYHMSSCVLQQLPDCPLGYIVVIINPINLKERKEHLLLTPQPLGKSFAVCIGPSLHYQLLCPALKPCSCLHSSGPVAYASCLVGIMQYHL